MSKQFAFALIDYFFGTHDFFHTQPSDPSQKAFTISLSISAFLFLLISVMAAFCLGKYVIIITYIWKNLFINLIEASNFNF